jgi:hypothetical protein
MEKSKRTKQAIRGGDLGRKISGFIGFLLIISGISLFS